MSDLDIFGSLILAPQLEDAAQGTIETWISTYLRRVERFIGKPALWLPNPKSYECTNDFDHWPEEQLPAILIMVPGISGRPERDGERNYRVPFHLKIGVVVSADTRKHTERLSKYYAGAIRNLIANKGSLGSFAVGSVWVDENYENKTSDHSQRTLSRAEVCFDTEVYGVVKALAGPATVPAEPATEPPSNPTVRGGKITIKPETP